MGPCCNVRCHNAVQAWQLGWAAPTATAVVHSGTLPPGGTLQYELPALTSFANRSASMVVVIPDWMPQDPAAPNPWVLYISYRQVWGFV